VVPVVPVVTGPAAGTVPVGGARAGASVATRSFGHLAIGCLPFPDAGLLFRYGRGQPASSGRALQAGSLRSAMAASSASIGPALS
jgi:hypothetical protein